MIEIYNNPHESEWEKLLKRPTQDYANLESNVKAIFEDIKANGDAAIKKYTKIFDGLEIEDFKVEDSLISNAEAKVSKDLKNAIDVAYDNIYKFHLAQQQSPVKVETMPGVMCWQKALPIERVGLYIPGGSAPLFSSILMLGIPAKIAGCEEVLLVTPPQKNGQVHPAMLYAAKKCNITKVYQIGGIQAIAGLSFGTESIEKVYKIFGPGNQYVTVAKQVSTQYDLAIDMPAGPSELLVLADESGNAKYIASDLLSQAEHGVDSQVILVTTSMTLATKTRNELLKQLSVLPRKAIAEKAIKNSKLIVVESEKDALKLVNLYSPEHLIVCVENEDEIISKITNAGSVFIGNYTPESAGDYASGTNHTLPTNGYAKQYSGVNLDAFMKKITYQKISKDGLLSLGKHIEIMAENEQLQAHKNAVSLRLEDIS